MAAHRKVQLSRASKRKQKKGAVEKERESEASPQRLIFRTGVIERCEWGRSAVSQAV